MSDERDIQNAVLREQLRAAEQRHADTVAQNRALQAQIRQLTALVKGMQKQLEELLRDKSGKAEKIDLAALLATSEVLAPADEPEKLIEPAKPSRSKLEPLPPPPDRKPPARPRQKPTRRPDPAPDAPHDTKTTPVEACRKCGSADVAKIGQESARRVHYVRAHVRVVDEIRDTCRCAKCGTFTTAPLPPTAVVGGVMAPSLLAHIAYSKGALHLPLARIAEDLARLDVHFAKGTMCDAVKHISRLEEPIVDAITDEAFAEGMLWFDGSGIKVLEPGERGQHRGQIAVFSTARAAIYHYSPDKGGEHAAAFLRIGTSRAFRGYLHADAASNADRLYEDGTIIECGCWYHARDKFDDARGSAPIDAENAIAWIAALFEVEHEADAAGDEPEQRLERRRRDSVPVLDGFLAWTAEVYDGYSPEEELPKAIRYVRNHLVALRRFLDDGRIHLTNNRAERDLGPLGRGRKAWLHAGSDEGGHRLANIYTIIETCRREDIDPFEYLVDTLPLLSTMKANRGRSAADLTPAAWKRRRNDPTR